MFGLSIILSLALAAQPLPLNPCDKENPTQCEELLLDKYIEELSARAVTEVQLDITKIKYAIAMEALAQRPVVEKETGLSVWELVLILVPTVVVVGAGAFGIGRLTANQAHQ